MQKALNGVRYNFEILKLHTDKKNFLFSIKATHKQTKRTSFITNVNAVLSGMNVDIESPTFWETDWQLNNKEASKLTLIAEQMISDKKFLTYLENYLDLDRKEGEWENHE